jgi:acetylornithine/N-succinyldiaminopimelate aminotransferase
MMLGVKLTEGLKLDEFVNAALNNGLIIIPAANNTFRVYPPLNIDMDVLNKGLDILQNTWEQFC